MQPSVPTRFVFFGTTSFSVLKGHDCQSVGVQHVMKASRGLQILVKPFDNVLGARNVWLQPRGLNTPDTFVCRATIESTLEDLLHAAGKYTLGDPV